jgi:hypothetical protein
VEVSETAELLDIRVYSLLGSILIDTSNLDIPIEIKHVSKEYSKIKTYNLTSSNKAVNLHR